MAAGRRRLAGGEGAWVAGQELEQERRYLGRSMVSGRRLLGRGVLALQYRKSVPRYLLMRAGAKRVKGLDTGRLSPLRLEEVAEPRLPTPDWVRVRPLLSGICGSDLGTLSAESSPYISPLTSPPLALGRAGAGAAAGGEGGR